MKRPAEETGAMNQLKKFARMTGASRAKAVILTAALLVFFGYGGYGCGGGRAGEAAPPRAANPGPLAGGQARGVRIIDGFSYPESVVVDPLSRRIFVSNMGERLAPTAKDGDGFISELLPDGTPLTARYLPRYGVLHAPRGMVILEGTLYVTDIDRVVGFDLINKRVAFELDLSSEKTSFLNDIAVMDNRTLLVSSTDTGRIYRVSLGGEPAFTVVAEGIAGPNGLHYDAITRQLYVAGLGGGNGEKGEVGVVSFAGDAPVYRSLTGPVGALDGLVLLPGGEELLFSDWVGPDRPGRMLTYDIGTRELSTLNLSAEVRGPSDFFYDRTTGRLLLPRMLEGKVMIEDMGGR